MFYHYSSNDNFQLEGRTYVQDLQFKPTDIWLSKDNEWENWRNRERFSLSSLTYKYQFTINMNNILIINTFDDLKDLIKEYALESIGLDWELISENYDGILFDNYYDIKEQLFKNIHLNFIKFSFYLLIDVSSACIWNLDCLEQNYE